MLRHLDFACALSIMLPSALLAQGTCIWGSFDSSRINYAAGTLTAAGTAGSGHVELRKLIAANGGTLATATSTLTATYLSSIKVFYTSLLSTSTGALSASEQTDLQNWVKAGGTLIVTGDYINTTQSDTFTSWLGVTFATPLYTGTGSPTSNTACPTRGINQMYVAGGATFNVPTGVNLLIAEDSTNKRPMMAEATVVAIRGAGRVLIFGDHNMFTDSYITRNDNRRLAENVCRWACASWNNYGSGVAGTSGVPSFTASANPVHGASITVNASNSLGSATTGLLIIGFAADSTPFLGGTLLATQNVLASLPIPAAGLALPVTVPSASQVCTGTPIYAQILERDGGAPFGVSFSPGLRLIVGR